jgi:tRNA G18 (ribose-2'-O)-methylase SpoU
MNVHDHLKSLTVAEIKDTYIKNTIPAASAMMHVTGDFNLSTLIRNSNFFGYERVFYVGGKKAYDRRGCVGTHNYIPVTFIKTEEEFVKTVKDLGYSLISVENNINYVSYDFHSLMNVIRNGHDTLNKPLFIFGEEQKGLSDYILSNSDRIVTISGRGTVRSLNVGTASGIVLSTYASLFPQTNV